MLIELPIVEPVPALSVVAAKDRFHRVLSVCMVVSNNGSTPLTSAEYGISPVEDARTYFGNEESRALGDYRVPGKVVTLTNPKRGRLEPLQENVWRYIPNAEFFGTDAFDATIVFAGRSVRLMYTVKSLNSTSGETETFQLECKRVTPYKRLS